MRVSVFSLGLLAGVSRRFGLVAVALAAGTILPAQDSTVAANYTASISSIDWTRLPAVPRWTIRVRTLGTLTDSAAKRDSMLALMRDALQGSGVTVHAAGTASLSEIVPEDFRPVPVINFDAGLNQKMSRKLSEKTVQRALKRNSGYFFSHQSVPFLVLGPLSIKQQDPDYIRMYVDHELYHVINHSKSGAKPADRELEAWVYQFSNWFYKLRAYQQRWDPLIDYYEDATPEAQKTALDALVKYYNEPPANRVTVDQIPEARKAFDAWLARRKADEKTAGKKLVIVLAAVLAPGHRPLQPNLP